MDNPATESSAIGTNEAASLFASMLDPEPQREQPADPAAEPEAKATETEAPAEVEAAAEDDPEVTIKIDGKDVQVKLSELKNGYQRQADYTRKTMEVSEQRKAAEAEASKARQERDAYAANLNQLRARTEALLTEQQNSVNWTELLQVDPVEYLKQQHLAQQRQATLQQVAAEQARVSQIQQAEQQEAQVRHIQAQHQALLDKLPEWKDEAKAKAEKAALREFLIQEGFDEQALNNITDARAVVLARKAMLYDQVMSKAQAAAKKVATLPTKVVRPGTGEGQQLDRRTSAYQRLQKSGSVDDAAAVFASMF